MSDLNVNVHVRAPKTDWAACLEKATVEMKTKMGPMIFVETDGAKVTCPACLTILQCSKSDYFQRVEEEAKARVLAATATAEMQRISTERVFAERLYIMAVQAGRG